MTDNADDQVSPISTREKRFEVVATLILAFAALATGWTGYQASLWDGIQSSNYTQASGIRTKAAQLRTEANQYRLADLSVFESFVNAYATGDEDLADFYRERFPESLDTAYTPWIALDPLNDPDAPTSPFVMPEYKQQADADADAYEARADELFADGEAANSSSDLYTLATLLFAVVLFFAAVSERFDYIRMRIVLLSLAGIGLVAGIIVATGQPITFS